MKREMVHRFCLFVSCLKPNSNLMYGRCVDLAHYTSSSDAFNVILAPGRLRAILVSVTF